MLADDSHDGGGSGGPPDPHGDGTTPNSGMDDGGGLPADLIELSEIFRQSINSPK